MSSLGWIVFALLATACGIAVGIVAGSVIVLALEVTR